MLVAEIGLPHLRVGAHLLGRSRRDDFAAQEHQHPVRMAEDDVHVVLGEQHPDPLGLRQRFGELHEIGAFAGRHAGGGLVHEEEDRTAGQGDGEFHALDVAVGEASNWALVRGVGHAHRARRRRASSR